MKGRFVVAQMEGCADKKKNLKLAREAVQKAKETYQADLILFPETFMSYTTSAAEQMERVRLAESVEGNFVTEMKKLAAAYEMWIVFGMRESAGEKNYNTIILLNEKGELVTHYRKTHLYDAFQTRESDEFLAGEALFTPIPTPFGVLGLFVCYEARFPEVARWQALHGAEILLMPTAWVEGKRKIEQLQILTSARALENTAYLLAGNLCGGECTGHSMIIDPLGEIIAQAEDQPALLYAEIDTEKIKSIREMVPSLKNRRPELYGSRES